MRPLKWIKVKDKMPPCGEEIELAKEINGEFKSFQSYVHRPYRKDPFLSFSDCYFYKKDGENFGLTTDMFWKNE